METDQQDLWRTQALQGYSARPGFVLGFHGTDSSIVDDIVSHRQEIRPSINSWDWIGHGIYFWKHSPARALEFAQGLALRQGSNIKVPAVLGAILDLGNCLDLLDFGNLKLLKETYAGMNPALKLLNNRPIRDGSSTEFLMRDLDCAVLEELHRKALGDHRSFDSVRAVFWEGNLLYPDAGFREKNHIQICIRNPVCIKGLFIPGLK